MEIHKKNSMAEDDNKHLCCESDRKSMTIIDVNLFMDEHTDIKANRIIAVYERSTEMISM